MPESADPDLDRQWRRAETFLVKVFRDADNALTGLVQHVRTGERQHFEDLVSLGEAIGRLSRGRAS